MMTSKGAWAWDLFPNMPAAGCCPSPSVQRATCAQTLRKECREWPKAGTLRAKPLLFGLNHSNVSSPVVAERLPELMQNLAAFQLVQGGSMRTSGMAFWLATRASTTHCLQSSILPTTETLWVRAEKCTQVSLNAISQTQWRVLIVTPGSARWSMRFPNDVPNADDDAAQLYRL